MAISHFSFKLRKSSIKHQIYITLQWWYKLATNPGSRLPEPFRHPLSVHFSIWTQFNGMIFIRSSWRHV